MTDVYLKEKKASNLIYYWQKGVDVKYMTKDERVRFTFRLPKELFDNLKNEAKKQGTSVNALILQILWDWDKNRNMQ